MDRPSGETARLISVPSAAWNESVLVGPVGVSTLHGAGVWAAGDVRAARGKASRRVTASFIEGSEGTPRGSGKIGRGAAECAGASRGASMSRAARNGVRAA
jgi:hypothetical protein